MVEGGCGERWRGGSEGSWGEVESFDGGGFGRGFGEEVRREKRIIELQGIV